MLRKVETRGRLEMARRLRSAGRPQRTRVFDIAGLAPGSCDIDLVREERSPSCCTLVLVAEWLQVPPSCAFAFDCARSICGFSRILVFDVALPLTAAALPAPPTAEEVPALPVELAPSPVVDAEVPPAAALPPDPIVELSPFVAFEPTVVAVGWARASPLKRASAPAMTAIDRHLMIVSYGRLTMQFLPE